MKIADQFPDGVMSRNVYTAKLPSSNSTLEEQNACEEFAQGYAGFEAHSMLAVPL